MVFMSAGPYIALEQVDLSSQGKNRWQVGKEEEVVVRLSSVPGDGPGQNRHDDDQVQDCEVNDGKEEHEECQDNGHKSLHKAFGERSSDGSSLKVAAHRKKIRHAVGKSSHRDGCLQQRWRVWLCLQK